MARKRKARAADGDEPTRSTMTITRAHLGWLRRKAIDIAERDGGRSDVSRALREVLDEAVRRG